MKLFDATPRRGGFRLVCTLLVGGALLAANVFVQAGPSDEDAASAEVPKAGSSKENPQAEKTDKGKPGEKRPEKGTEKTPEKPVDKSAAKPGEKFGDRGFMGGGAAGFELDSFDVQYGSPRHGIVLAKGNGANLVMMAFAGTSAAFFGMALLSSVVKRDLSGLSRFLFIGAIGILVVGIANVFIQSGALMMTLSVLAILVFTAFILVDLKRVRDGEETNYVTATLGVYLSLYNVFQSLLALFGIMGGDD